MTLAGKALAAAPPDGKPADAATNRVSVAVIRFENLTGDPGLGHWGYTADTIFRNCLHEVRALRVLPDPTLDYGLRKLQIKSGNFISATQAQQLGETIEAQRVVTGSYKRDGEQWQLSLRVLKVATGALATNLTAIGTNWFQLRDQLAEPLLAALGVTASSAERDRLMLRWTKSATALEWINRARGSFKDKLPSTEWEQCARRALDADPDCAEAYVILGASLGAQGKFSAAKTALGKAAKLDPTLARAQVGLGNLALLTGRVDEAVGPLETAARLEPDYADVYTRLGEIAMLGKAFPVAEANFMRGIQLSPYQAGLHANLARAYVLDGKRADALRELALAEQLAGERDVNAEDRLAWCYARLDDTPKAIEHYEKLIAAAQQLNLSPKRIDAYQKELRMVKAALQPAYVKAMLPKEYTPETMAAALREKLTPEELTLAADPLAVTPEIAARAKELTRGAMNDLQKAQILFYGLTGHLDTGEGPTRTAAEVLAAWNSPGAAFRCQEYARLYVALARAAGLRAFFVDVTIAYDGDRVAHNCAAIVDHGKVLLVDPGYHWFGIPHKQFRLLDDVQAIGEYLDQTRDLAQTKVAVKLEPDSAVAHYNLAVALLKARQPEAAREELASVARLDPDGGYANALQALLALHEDQPREAADFARKGLVAWPPEDGYLYFVLGTACLQQGQQREAREAFRAALQRTMNDSKAEAARTALAKINEALGADD